MTALLAAGGPRALWFTTRGTGVISLVLLTAVVALGVAGSRRFRSDRLPRFLVVGLHRNLTLLALAFLGVHIGTTVLDGFAPIGLKDAVVPFTSAYRPVWLGLGAIAFDLLLALTITSLLRARIGYRLWRSLHWLAYLCWPVALTHALGTGTDARAAWLQTIAVICVGTVGAALVVRLRGESVTGGARVAAAAVAALAALGVFIWYRSGPDRPGWSARAGTPRSLLAAAPVVTHRPASTIVKLPSPPFSAQLSGRLTTASEAGTGLVDVNIRGRTSGSAQGVFWIRLQGLPADGGGVSMTSSGASLGTATAPNAYVGKIVGLDGTRLELALKDSSGTPMAVQVDLQIDPSSNAVSGVLRAEPGDGESS